MENLIKNNTLVVILGPTASGKTAVSVELSKLLDIEIISADSRQIYKHLDIGTAKPAPEELSAVKHHFIDIIMPDESYSAGRFGTEAEKTANEILCKGILPVAVGGSGLYIKSLCEGLFDDNEEPDNSQTEEAEQLQKNIRANLQRRLDEEGRENLYKELKSVDPVSALKYEDMNPRRIMRTLEYFYITGKPLSEVHTTNRVNRNFNVVYFGIYFERQELYGRINKRTVKMWESGLCDEVKKVLSMGFSPSLNSLNTVGYKECIAFLNNKYDEKTASEEIKKNTRRYAKRQMTWFRANDKITWLSGNYTGIANKIYEKLKIMKF